MKNIKAFSTKTHKTLKCPYCGTVSYADFLFYERNYYRCQSCSLIFAELKRENEIDIGFYRDCYFDACSRDQLSEQRREIYGQILSLLEKFGKPGSLLDVGCGCGFFLKEAKIYGWQVTGIDPSRKSIDYARSLIGEAALCGTMDDIPADHRFDAISMINVLDHMTDFRQQLQKIHNLILPGGILYLRFPNGLFHSSLMCLLRKLSAERFITDFLIFHEYVFTPKTIRRCLDDVGFIEIQVLNSPLTGGHIMIGGRALSMFIRKKLGRFTWFMFKIPEILSGGRWVWGPSLQIIARKGKGG